MVRRKNAEVPVPMTLPMTLKGWSLPWSANAVPTMTATAMATISE